MRFDLCAQNMLTILGWIVNMIWRGDLYDHLIEHEKISTLITNKIFTLSPQIYEENDCLLRHVYCNWTCNYRTRLVIQPDLPLEEGEAVVVNCRNLTHGVDLYKHSGVTHLIQKSNQNPFPARKDLPIQRRPRLTSFDKNSCHITSH